MEIYFSNQEELYNRLLPALRIKKKQLKKDINNIKEQLECIAHKLQDCTKPLL